jgi:hypothetical protein
MLFQDLFQHTIHLTDERWNYITSQHPEIKPYKDRLGEVASGTDLIKKSRSDKDVWLYYRFFTDIFGGKYILVVVKREESRHFVVTAYITDYIKGGELVWEKKV